MRGRFGLSLRSKPVACLCDNTTVEQSSNLPSIAFYRLGSMGSRLAGFQMAFSLCRHAGSVEYHQLKYSHARAGRRPGKVQTHY